MKNICADFLAVFTVPIGLLCLAAYMPAANSATQMITIVGVPAGGPSVSVPSSIIAGSSVPITITNGPGNDLDWVAVGVPGGPYSSWAYLHGLSNGIVNLPAPPELGAHDARLYPNNSGTIAASAPFTIVPATISFILTPPAPVISDDTPIGTTVMTIAIVTDGAPFAGQIRFGAPNYDAGGAFALSGDHANRPPERVIVNGPLANNTTKKITLEAVP
jgi:hypothetical protein